MIRFLRRLVWNVSRRMNMKIWDLVFAHHYEEALKAYDKVVQDKPDDYLILANRATVLLCMARLDDALRGFLKANELLVATSHGLSAGYSEDIATIQWLKGTKAEAVSTLRANCESIKAGHIGFTDSAGGAGAGLLLWFMSAVAAYPEDAEYSSDYLRFLSKRSKIRSWPGPVALYLLGKASLADVLRNAGGADDILEVAAKAKGDVLVRRQFCQTLFYLALQKYLQGDAPGFLKGMSECSQLENPIIEREWYLAKAEATGRDPLTRPASSGGR